MRNGGHKVKEAYNPGAGGVPKVFQRRHMASPHGLKDFIWHLPQSLGMPVSQVLSGGKFRIMLSRCSSKLHTLHGIRPYIERLQLVEF